MRDVAAAGGQVAFAGGCYWIGCNGAVPLLRRTALERQRRLDELRKDPPKIKADATGIPWIEPQARYLPPPTPEKQIQPAYRDRSVLRSEYRDADE